MILFRVLDVELATLENKEGLLTSFRGMAEHDPDPDVLKVVKALRVHREYDRIMVAPANGWYHGLDRI